VHAGRRTSSCSHGERGARCTGTENSRGQITRWPMLPSYRSCCVSLISERTGGQSLTQSMIVRGIRVRWGMAAITSKRTSGLHARLDDPVKCNLPDADLLIRLRSNIRVLVGVDRLRSPGKICHCEPSCRHDVNSFDVAADRPGLFFMKAVQNSVELEATIQSGRRCEWHRTLQWQSHSVSSSSSAWRLLQV
jgi:hypothetical protein